MKKKFKQPNKFVRKFLRFFGSKPKELGEIRLSDMNPIKRTIFITWSNKRNIAVSMIVFIIAATVAFAFFRQETVRVNLSLNYEEASKGQNPNRTRYNVYEFKSDEVMQMAIDYAGLGDVITPEQLSQNIDIIENNSNAIDPKDTTSYYISSSYQIKYTKNREIKDVSTEDMMKLICKAYNEYFHERYVGNKSVLKYQLGDIDDMEYTEIGKLFTQKSDEMLRYIQQRIDENATFSSDTTGESFQTIRKMIQNVQNYSIKKYNSFVLETGISRNQEHYLRTLSYSNEVMTMKYRKYMIDYDVRKNGVANYDAGMIGTVMVPSINSRNQYYMSRTNTGTDYMTLDADYFLSQAKSVERTIIENNDIMEKVGNSSPIRDDYTKANQLIESVNEELKTVASIANTTDRDYLKHATKDYLNFTVTSNTALNIILIQDILLSSVAFLLVLCVLGYLIDGYIRDRGLINSEEL
ncbi:MAG: hypothetical protein LIO59_04945 [Oscillospiraceae bacterium]|nr:hypothetical protein [Oscillospiraceae bacterium]